MLKFLVFNSVAHLLNVITEQRHFVDAKLESVPIAWIMAPGNGDCRICFGGILRSKKLGLLVPRPKTLTPLA